MELLKRQNFLFWFFFATFFIYSVFQFFFGEILPVNDGLGWDGYRYGSIVMHSVFSNQIDDYLSFRVFPSLLVRAFFLIFHIEMQPENIVKAFQVLNITCILCSFFYLNKIFQFLKIEFKIQLLGWLLFVITYPVFKFSFYYPVMTDVMALLLGTMLLYFYLSNQKVNLILISLIGAFTFPVVLVLGIVLLYFPANNEDEIVIVKQGKYQKMGAVALTGVFAVVVYYTLYVKETGITMAYALKEDPSLYWLSIPILCTVFYFYALMALSALSKDFFRWKNLFKLNYILSVFLLFLIVKYAAGYVNVFQKASKFLNPMHFIETPIVHSTVRPAIFINSHVNYYGVVIILCIIFFNRIIKSANMLGRGVVLAMGFNLILFTFTSESRCFINLLPWMVVLVMVAIKGSKIPALVWPLVILVNIFASKIWMNVNYDVKQLTTHEYPNQFFYMNLGPWMSHDTWKVLFILTLLFTLVFGVLFYKNEIIKKLKLNNGK